MTKEYRSRGRIVQQLLSVIQSEGPLGVSRLTMVANLTHSRVQEHLAGFEKNGLIERKAEGEKVQWGITTRGNEALTELRRVDQAMQAFGLEF